MGMVAGIIGVALTAFGAISGAQGAQAAGTRGAEAELINAGMAENDAELAILSSRVEQQRIQRAANKARGTIVSRTAASGFSTTDDGPLNLIAENAAAEEREIQRAMFVGETGARASIQEANNARARARGILVTADAQASSSMLGGATSILGGLSGSGGLF